MGRKKHLIEYEIRICKNCKEKFNVNKKQRKQFCSSICAKSYIGKQNKGKKHSIASKEKISIASSGKNNPMYGKSFYDIWIKKYGKEIADKKLKEFKSKKKGKKHTKEHNKKISESLTGEKNPFFGRKHTLESRAKISENHRDCKGEKNPMYRQGEKIKGEKNGSWNGGISIIEYGPKWTNELKTKIRKRDNFRCVICQKNGYDVHHIDYDKYNNINENLITLCRSCHAKTNFNRESWIKFFKPIINEIYENKK